ncbi:hypothetical protein SAMN05661093_10165 [Kibdelosporangium aridum]|uniref:Uncharacterized protein n=1 Tax=Kibdelosporangium aridum TaxID=2030 RepID=A0A1W2FXW5_KIBAR|nr:hypothetical protein SAMN05661093_10165 [Kibdelosporangium aridum]
MPSVATNGLILKYAINTPLTAPTTAPQPIPAAIAVPGAAPFCISSAEIVLAKPIVAATERSNPPTTSANICPTETTSRMLPSRDMLSRLVRSANISPWLTVK